MAREDALYAERERTMEQHTDTVYRDLYRQGMNDAAIAHTTGTSRVAVYEWRKRNHFPPGLPEPEHRYWVKYLAGWSDGAIATFFACPLAEIIAWQEEYELPAQCIDTEFLPNE